MAERTISVKELDDITECAICRESFSDPRSLPCVHTFCLKCIAKWSDTKRPGDSVDCPLCRKEVTIPSNGVGELPKNTFIAKLLSVKDAINATSADTKLCDWCVADISVPVDRKNQAMRFCVDCQESLCGRCHELHSKMKMSRAHRTVTLGEGLDSQTACLPTLCDLHPTKELELFCLECREALCVMCFLTQHTGHKSAEIEKVTPEFRLEIRSQLSELEASSIKNTDLLMKLQNKRQKITENSSKIEAKIRTRADELHATIERHKEQVLSELNDLRKGKLKEVDRSIDGIKQNIELVESLNKYSDELLKKGSNSDIARESRDLTQRSIELKQRCDKDEKMCPDDVESFSFIPSATTFTRVSNVVGRISGTKLCPSLVISLGSSPVQAVCTFQNQLFVTRCNTKKIEVFNSSTFEWQCNILLNGAGSKLNGLAACATNNCLYASDHTNAAVHKVIGLSTFSTMSLWPVDRGPEGLSINRLNNLLIAYYGPQKVAEYTTDGSLVRHIPGSSNYLYHAIELNSGVIVVSQVGPEKYEVIVKSVDGKIIRSYGSETTGSGPGQMKWPCSLAVDGEGFILVADRDSNTIRVLDPELTESRVLPLSLDTPLISPRGLCFDESRGRLYIGEDNCKQSRLLVFDGVFHLSSLF